MTEAPRLQAELIYNPKAGRKFRLSSNERYAKRVARRLERKHKWDIVATPTTESGDASRMAAKAAAEGKRVVIVVAGDGTINEAESSLSGTDTILGAIPRGGMNLWGRETHTPRRAKKAADALAKGMVHDIDTVVVEQRGAEVKTITLSAVLGLGYDGLVFNTVHPVGKERKKGGVMQYFKQAVLKMPKAETTFARITDENGDTHDVKNLIQLWVHNTQNLAFLRFRRDAKCDDGLFEITAIEATSATPRRNVLSLAGQLVRDIVTPNKVHADETRLSGKWFHISLAEPLFGEYDGESMQRAKEFDIYVKEGASRRLVPHSRRSKVFKKSGIPLAKLIPSAGR